jgi:hypothetical protein
MKIKRLLVKLVVAGLLINTGWAAQVDKPDDNTLWFETFSDQSDLKAWKSKGDLKIINDTLIFKPIEKNFTFGRYVKWNPDYPYLQIDFSNIEPLKGYRGWTVMPSIKNSKILFSSAGGWAPGLWTANVLDYMPTLANKKQKAFFLVNYIYGGIASFKSYKMVAQPENALLLSIDGEQRELKAGDKIQLTVLLKEGGKDVTVTIKKAYCLRKVNVGDAGYIQLASEDEGKTWTGELTLPEIKDKKDLPPAGLVFEANILGGKFRKLYTSNPWKIIVTKK